MIRRVLLVLCLLVACFSVFAYIPGRVTIVNTAFTVSAGQAKVFPFHVGDRSRVTGRFRASGGRGNDIEALILDGDAYENWRNGHTVNTYYNSGKITVANIDVTLGAGDYVLIFNNMFSAITPKAVEARVDLDW